MQESAGKRARWSVIPILVVGSLASAAPAPAAEIDLSASGGGVAGYGYSDYEGSAAGGFAVQFTWPIVGRLRLGIRQSLAFSALPYGSNDGEPVIGERSGYNPDYLEESLTAFPLTTFVLGFGLTSWLELDASVGVGFIASSELSERSLIPRPACGVGINAHLVDVGSWALLLRLQADYLPEVFDSAEGLFLPQLAVVLRT